MSSFRKYHLLENDLLEPPIQIITFDLRKIELPKSDFTLWDE